MKRRSLVLALVTIGLVVAATSAAVGFYSSGSVGSASRLANANPIESAGPA